MLFVGILQHTPAQCPGHNKALFDELAATMPRLPEIASKHKVKIVGLYSLLPPHKMVAVVDAPNFEAVTMLLMETGLSGWNTAEISQAYSPEEAMKMAPVAQRR